MDIVRTPSGRDYTEDSTTDQQESLVATPATPVVNASSCGFRSSRMAIDFQNCNSGSDHTCGRFCHAPTENEDHQQECEECSICQSPLFVYNTNSSSKPNSDKKVQVLPRCGHSFHIGCIRKSVEFGHRHAEKNDQDNFLFLLS